MSRIFCLAMMQKTLIWILALIVFSSFVYAEFNFTDCVTYTKFNGTTLDHLNNYVPDTESGISYNMNEGSVGEYLVIDNGDYIEYNNQADFGFIEGQDFTFSTMFMITSSSDNFNRLFDKYPTTEGYEFYYGGTPDNSIYSILFSAGSNINTNCGMDGYANYKQGNWFLFTWTRNGTTMNYYINKTLITQKTHTDCDNDIGGSANLRLGRSLAANMDSDGGIDNFLICHRALSDAEIGNIWENYYLMNRSLDYVATVPVPGLSLSTNLTSGNYTTDIDFSFSGTPANTGDLFNCSVYWNETINQSFTDVNITALQIGILDYSGLERGYDINVTCANNNATDSLKVTDVFLDSVLPDLTINSSFTNNSMYYDDTTFSISIGVYDTNLFAVNYTLYNDAGQVQDNFFTQNLTVPLYMINRSNSTAALGVGGYLIRAEAWDSHTDNLVREMDFFYGTNYIKADDIQFISDDLKFYNNKDKLVTYFYLSKDRYKFKATFETEGYYHEIELKTARQLTFISKSAYLCHFVDFDSKRWIDFAGKNVKDCQATKLAENHYLIRIEHYTITDEVEFESIGDLNFNFAEWRFNVTAAPDPTDLILLGINETLYSMSGELSDLNDAADDFIGVVTMIFLSILYLGLLYIGARFESLLLPILAYVVGGLLGLDMILMFDTTSFVRTGAGIALVLVNAVSFIMYMYSADKRKAQEE